MSNRNLSELYQSVIKQHDREPFHYQKVEGADHEIEAYNPLCGDQFRLFLQIENGVIKDAHFYGYGCAISKASTSVLVKKIIGNSISGVHALLSDFHNIVSSEFDSYDEELNAFAAARHFPERLHCATLSWTALEDFLAKER